MVPCRSAAKSPFVAKLMRTYNIYRKIVFQSNCPGIIWPDSGDFLDSLGHIRLIFDIKNMLAPYTLRICNLCRQI